MNKPTLLTSAFLVGICLISEARAGIVYYNISNPGGAGTESGYADLQEVNIKIDGNTVNNAFTGGIQLTETGSPVPGLPTTYTTICTDIQGTLYLGQTYGYNTPVSSFNGPPVQSGVNPTWGADNGPGHILNSQANASQAIQNAAYLFYTYGGLTSAGITGTADQMAGLQLAVWEVLYDTTDSGQVVENSGSRFQVLAGGDAAAIADANTLIASLNSQSKVGKFGYAGDLLFPNSLTPQGDGEPPQELLIAVPEPTTMLAGALLFLPFAASTVRILRKNRAV